MSRSLYSPRLSDDVVRALYREGQRRRVPMTRLADDLLREALADAPVFVVLPSVCDSTARYQTSHNPDAA